MILLLDLFGFEKVLVLLVKIWGWLSLMCIVCEKQVLVIINYNYLEVVIVDICIYQELLVKVVGGDVGECNEELLCLCSEFDQKLVGLQCGEGLGKVLGQLICRGCKVIFGCLF